MVTKTVMLLLITISIFNNIRINLQVRTSVSIVMCYGLSSQGLIQADVHTASYPTGTEGYFLVGKAATS
jgi:hypothetical protein